MFCRLKILSVNFDVFSSLVFLCWIFVYLVSLITVDPNPSTKGILAQAVAYIQKLNKSHRLVYESSPWHIGTMCPCVNHMNFLSFHSLIWKRWWQYPFFRLLWRCQLHCAKCPSLSQWPQLPDASSLVALASASWLSFCFPSATNIVNVAQKLGNQNGGEVDGDERRVLEGVLNRGKGNLLDLPFDQMVLVLHYSVLWNK